MTKTLLVAVALLSFTLTSAEAAPRKGRRVASESDISRAMSPSLIVKLSSVTAAESFGDSYNHTGERIVGVIESVQAVGIIPDAPHGDAPDLNAYAGKRVVIQGHGMRRPCFELAALAVANDRKFSIELSSTSFSNLELVAPSVSIPEGEARLRVEALGKVHNVATYCVLSRD